MKYKIGDIFWDCGDATFNRIYYIDEDGYHIWCTNTYGPWTPKGKGICYCWNATSLDRRTRNYDIRFIKTSPALNSLLEVFR